MSPTPQSALGLLGVRHAAFPTRDLDAAIAFYRDVMGFQPYYVGSEDWAMLLAGDTSLSLIVADTDRRGQARGGSHHQHLGLTVPARESVEAWHRRLREAKVGSLGKPTEHRDGSYGFYFRDPDGNPLELIFIPYRSHHQPAPDEAWLLYGSPAFADLPERLRAHVPGVRVALADAQSAPQRVAEWAKDPHGLPLRVRVMPLSVADDASEVVRELSRRFPKTHFEVAGALAEHPLVKEAVLAAIVTTVSP